MKVLYINASFREESRTARLAENYISKVYKDDEVTVIELGDMKPPCLDRDSLKCYLNACSSAEYEDPMFDIPKQFRDAQEIVISGPFWNFSLPAILHAYLEIVCTQGITFDVAQDGTYLKLCKANKLTFVVTAGGPLTDPENDHAFGYIKQLNDYFWGIPEVRCISADCLDIEENDPEEILEEALKEALKVDPEG